MRFWEYLKKEPIDPAYEEAKKRIMELHKDGTLSYINGMYRLEGQEDEMDVEYVRGTFFEGDICSLYDNEGKKSGSVKITSIYYGKDEHKGKFSQDGVKGRMVFETIEANEGTFWYSQYVKK